MTTDTVAKISIDIDVDEYAEERKKCADDQAEETHCSESEQSFQDLERADDGGFEPDKKQAEGPASAREFYVKDCFYCTLMFFALVFWVSLGLLLPIVGGYIRRVI